MAAHIYYPEESRILERYVSGSNLVQLILNVDNQSVFYFDGTGSLSSITASGLTVTSASYSLTSSYALNAGSGGGAEQLNTGSLYPITSSWSTNAETSSKISGSMEINAVSLDELYLRGSLGSIFKLNIFEYDTGSGTVILDGTSSFSVGGDSLIFVTSSITDHYIASSSYAETASRISGSLSIDAISVDELYMRGSLGSLFKLRIFEPSTGSGIVDLDGTSSFSVGGDSLIFITSSIVYQTSSSFSDTASYALNAENAALQTASFYPITSSWSLYSQTASLTLTSSYTTVTESYSQTADYAPVLFENVRIIDGNLLIKSSYTGEWYKLDIYDDGSGSYTTELTASSATGSILYTGSINCATASYAISASYAPQINYSLNTGSLYPITSSWATNAINWNSSSVISLINTKQNIIPTGSITPFTSSWAQTSSYAIKKAMVISSSFANPFPTNASLGDHFRTIVNSNFLLQNPTNAIDGQRITWEFIQNGTGGYTCSYDTKFAFGNVVSATDALLNQTASKRDFMVSIYNQIEDKHYVVGFNTGF